MTTELLVVLAWLAGGIIMVAIYTQRIDEVLILLGWPIFLAASIWGHILEMIAHAHYRAAGKQD